MIDPLLALIVGSLILITTAVIFWPGKGILGKLKKSSLDSKKVLLEDALKHIYDSEYKNIQCTMYSLAGSLNISTDSAAKVLAGLEEQKLAVLANDLIKLTKSGKSYALRVIRVHRLYEKYLAEETGISEVDWHAEAELKEHTISFEEANELAVKLNNPLFDPHGDPIPSESGKLPASEGISLSKLEEGKFGHIIHLEDEPGTVYAQIIALGLYPGMQVKMISVLTNRIIFEANGEEKVLAPLFANNITVTVIENETAVTENFLALSSLNVGENAKVLGIAKACRGKQRRRLMDLGVVPGTLVTAMMKSIGGDPLAYIIRDTTIALRKDQADKIFITEMESK